LEKGSLKWERNFFENAWGKIENIETAYRKILETGLDCKLGKALIKLLEKDWISG